jgi:spore maturation protein CgeB
MLRIMGCSALCLAKWYPGIEKDFTDGANIVVWKDIPELITKIRYYLDHPDEAFTIGRAASTLVHVHHTWATRLQELEYAMRKFPKHVIAPVRTRVPFSYIISR